MTKGETTTHENLLQTAFELESENERLHDVLDKIMKEINTPNRGTCDYFIVDRIEKIINEYRKEQSNE